jgi:hypothetical protein
MRNQCLDNRYGRSDMHTRNPIFLFLCVALVAMLLMGMVAQAVSYPRACATMACCHTATAGTQQGQCPPEHRPQTCTPQAPCCDIDPLGSPRASLPAAAVQIHSRAIDTALPLPPLASDPIITAEREFDHCRYLPPWGGTIPISLRTMTLLC